MGLPVLHCYSDYKWTGPSEPVLQLCTALSRQGWRSDLACSAPSPGTKDELLERAQAAGIRSFEAFSPRRWPRLMNALRDRWRLAELVGEGGYRIVHCHGSWDHLIVGSLRGVLRSHGIPLVRTDHGAREYRNSPLWRYYFGPNVVDHVIVLADRFAVQAVSRMGLDPATVTTVRGAVDVDAFRPLEAPCGIRESFGLAQDDVIVGVVARVQRHRRFDMLLSAARMVRAQNARVKIVVCGRGSRKEELLDKPVKGMGLQDTVIPLGYRRDDYREIMAMFDAGLMLVPGSDGSCRAALQMAAMGKPLIVQRRGTLPDIVRDGETGTVVEDTPEDLAEAILQMAKDRNRRGRWGQAGRQRICQYYSLPRQVDEVIAVYHRLLGLS